MSAARTGGPAREVAGSGGDGSDLLELVHDCELAGIARKACLVRLSGLGADTRRPHLLRLARAALEPLARADRSRLFVLANHDLVMVWRGNADALLAEVRAAIGHLLSDAEPCDPIEAGIWEEFSLPDAGPRLRMVVEGYGATPVAALSVMPPLDAQALAVLEQRLIRVDVARFVRRQAVGVRHALEFSRAWDRRVLDVEELTESLLPGVAPRADAWLFRRLTRSLDRRMLALLASHGELDDAGPFSVELNVASVLGPEFLRFDLALPAGLRGQVVLELAMVDMLSDLRAFRFARDFATARGYRLMVNDLSTESLGLCPLAQCGLDLLGVRWSPGLADVSLEAAGVAPHSVILSAADTNAALAWGARQGIGLYQGRLVVMKAKPSAAAAGRW